MNQALFARTPPSRAQKQPTRGAWWMGVPLFWRLLGVNLMVVFGGALVGTWLTQRLVLSGTFTPMTHALLVLAALCLSAGLTILVLRETFGPVRSLQDRLEADAASIRDKNEQAEKLAAQVIMAQEDERRRVARELHDEAGQALTAVIIGLERGLASMPEVYAADLPIQPRQLIANLRDLAVHTLDEVRKLALELRPSVLDDLGLVAALRQYVRSIEDRSGLATHLTVLGWEEESERLPAEVETALFRITQEALTNAIRHAHASSVQVRLRRTTTQVTLEVRDDGVGLMAVPSSEAGEHLGMFGMRERARLLGGELVASTVSPRGTLIRVNIPM